MLISFFLTRSRLRARFICLIILYPLNFCNTFSLFSIHNFPPDCNRISRTFHTPFRSKIPSIPDSFPSKMKGILIILRLLFYLNNCRFLHWDTTVSVISKLYDHIIICDIDQYTSKSTCCQYCISYFHRSNHRLNSLLLFLCGRNRKNHIPPISTAYTKIMENIPPAPPDANKPFILNSSYFSIKHYCYDTQFLLRHQVIFRNFMICLYLSACESFQFLLLVFFISSFLDRCADFFHHIVVEIQIMQHAQTHTKHLFCFQQWRI